MSHANTTSRRSGFTLVEMLIIAPIALLVITGFVALMVTMVGDVIVNRSQNVMTYDIQSALNTIERDVRLSTEFLVTSGPMLTPQGRNGATTAFTTASGDLILGTIATNKNPIDPTRSFVHYKTPNSCGGGQEYQNRIFFITVIYTVRDGSLWRRTYVPSVNTNDLCQQPWQVNTCAPGYATATRCQSNDSEILKNVKATDGFKVKYYMNPEDTIELAAASATTASSISVTLEGEQTSAGRTVSASSTARATKLSSREVNLAPPAAPVVTGSSSGRDAVFSWPSVPTATSYIVQYNANGTGWKTATENTTETTISIQSGRGTTVSAKVFARNSTGASPEGVAAATITAPNVMLDFSKWTLSGTATYNASTGELTLGSNGTAQSPVVRVDQPRVMHVGGDFYATTPSAHSSLAPQGGYHVSISYFGSDGVTPAVNSSNYTSNGCAPAIALNSWQYTVDSCNWFAGGPNVYYASFRFNGPQGGYTSSNLRIKNPLLIPRD